MKCPHCLVEFHAEVELIQVADREESGPDDGVWAIERYQCPNPECRKAILFLTLGKNSTYDSFHQLRNMANVQNRTLVYPKSVQRPVPPEVPRDYADDYIEACDVLPDSPKASAALSRRCLQRLLREVAKVKHGNLNDEIQQVIDSKVLPSHLVESIDAIRNIGNFAAHPIKSERSGEVIEVEPGEAEWNLDVLESLFDFCFVQPAITQKRRNALNQKLADAKKPPMK